METVVYSQGPYREFAGKSIGRILSVTDEKISEGLAKRLVSYADKRFIESGLSFCLEWDCVVETLDASVPVGQRTYHVMRKSSEGTEISLVEIHCRSGWPFVDHRFEISTK